MNERSGAGRLARGRPSPRTLLAGVLLAAGIANQAASAVSDDWGPLSIANEVVQPGTKHKFTYLGARSFEGSFVDFAIYAAQGTNPGPTLCVTAGIHGDEINSVEIARRVFAGVDVTALKGTLLVLPAVNASGFRTMNRYMPDRRDLNRAFPGSPNGSVARILADALFSGVIRRCTHLVDLHTGSNFRTNVPQVRVDAESADALEMARAFAVGIIVSGAGTSGTLRREAMRIGIPAIIFESGPPYIFVEPDIVLGTEGVLNVMGHLGMIEVPPTTKTSKLLTDSWWVRTPRGQGGIYLPSVRLGDSISSGQVLATVTDPITDERHEIRAEQAGVVVGMALPQIVLSGYGLLHVGVLE